MIALSRRETLLGLAATFLPLPVSATPSEVAESIVSVFGDRPIAEGPIKLELPALAETGNSVPLTVSCETQAFGRVRRLAVFAEMNPRPMVCVASFGPMAADARITTNIRLASTQDVVCVAELEDGKLITSRQSVRVVVGACTTLPGRY
ncbi:hypothetical protein KEU06_01075 [Pseudaminobacter sp. 19-2017]|uniref:Ig-like SoxY domain-containing protein n=1 Tax=Pseudaminobacter soli (ex Zhang et al. 2022) TaxID=2831468 RepID=A0A942DVA2_9HYPH|nr:thiosulfate oxidation carrier protein SoxY [Pseudaminobacter soli]MBS3647218.1 hypothetical protein [Pseudaminobacter soli]